MRFFKDSQEREWRVELTIDAMRTLKGAGLDLANIEQPREKQSVPIGQEIETDLLLFADVLWRLLKPQADTLGVSDADFFGLLNGPTLKAARQAFREELADFFQCQPYRQAFLAKTLAVLEAVTDEMQQADVDEVVARMRGSSSTTAPESSESVLVP